MTECDCFVGGRVAVANGLEFENPASADYRKSVFIFDGGRVAPISNPKEGETYPVRFTTISGEEAAEPEPDEQRRLAGGCPIKSIQGCTVEIEFRQKGSQVVETIFFDDPTSTRLPARLQQLKWSLACFLTHHKQLRNERKDQCKKGMPGYVRMQSTVDSEKWDKVSV